MSAVSTAPSSVRSADLDPVSAQRLIQSGEASLVDVREPDENAKERIAGSTLIPLSKFNPASVAALGAKKVIMHCKGGTRSAEACRLASSLPIPVFSLKGGIEGWKAAGLPVERGGGGCGISVMHQTQLVIGVGVLAGTAAGYWVSPWFLGIPAFLGSGLVFAGASGTCGLAALLSMMPWNKVSGASCGSDQCS